MTINTLSAWNARLVMSSCCEMPPHPQPLIEVQSINTTADFRYTSLQAGGTYMRTMRQSWSDGGYLLIEINQAWQAMVHSREIPPIYRRTVQDVGPRSGKSSVSYSNPIDIRQTAMQAEQAIRQGILESDYQQHQQPVAAGIGATAYRRFNHFGPNDGGALGWMRFRVHPPIGFKSGHYCKVTYDTILVRPGVRFYEAEFLETDSVELRSTEPADWIVIDPPQEDGDIYIVNVGYTSYRSPYGTKPSYYDVWP